MKKNSLKNSYIIALISDIHANKPALDAALKQIKQKKANIILNAGDSIGYGPFPNETLDTIKKKKIKTILGNYDEMVLKVKKDPISLPKHPQKMFSAYWTFQNLSEKNKQYLKQLPEKLQIKIANWHIIVVHGSPFSNSEYLDDKTPLKRLIEIANKTKANIIVSGHSHRPSHRIVQKTHFINPGSIGRPDDGNPSASYALLYLFKNHLLVKHFRAGYNLSKTLSALKNTTLPLTIENMFKNGINFEKASKLELKNKTAMSLNQIKNAQCSILKTLKRYSDECEMEHAKQVTKQSQKLFLALNHHFKLGKYEYLLLQYAALLHDIGWNLKDLPHHKASMLLILNDRNILLKPLEKTIVALVARYHRKSTPQPTDYLFCKLPKEHRITVEILASLLRIADALDASHASLVNDISVKEDINRVLVVCKSSQPFTSEEKSALIKKKGLLETIMQKKIYFKTRIK